MRRVFVGSDETGYYREMSVDELRQEIHRLEAAAQRERDLSDDKPYLKPSIDAWLKQDAAQIAATALVRHDPLTGRAYVHLSPIMASGLQAQGYDPATYARDYAESLKRAGLWPADLPVVQRRRVKRWRRRSWRVVVGRAAPPERGL